MNIKSDSKKKLVMTLGGLHLTNKAQEVEGSLDLILVQWSPLNGITVNGINRLIGSIFLRYPRPVWPQ